MKLTIGFFLAFRAEDLRWPLTAMAGTVGVTVSAPKSLLASPSSLAEAMTSSDYACQ